MTTETPPPETRPRRQRPGLACEECRRRKLRCDGAQPKCSVCVASRIECKASERTPRGPKKGYLTALKNRVAMLEDCLAASQGSPTDEGAKSLSLPSVDVTISKETSPGSVGQSASSTSILNTVTCEPGLSQFSGVTGSPQTSDSIGATPGIGLSITESMQDELDQLYFDRVHPWLPLLHQRRYLSWSKSLEKQKAQQALQYAMWALTSLLSSQFRNLDQTLHQEARALLEASSFETNIEANGTEQTQAWVIVATYELARLHHQQAWMSVGRAFRIIQLLRFHEIDNLTNSVFPQTDFIETEQRRRVFWMAYFLDHCFSMRNNWPVTLTEQAVCTRLPAQEVGFQSGRAVLGDFLADALTDIHPKVLSPFNECLILVTIAGRGLFYSQQYNICSANGDFSSSWLDQDMWLNHVLAVREKVLTELYPSPTEGYDSMLLFTNILCQSTIIYLYKGMETLTWPREEERMLVQEREQSASSAATKVVELAVALEGYPSSKIHPLAYMPLFLTAEFLYTQRATEISLGQCYEDLLATFRKLKNIGNLDENYTDLLRRTCIAASLAVGHESQR